MAKRKYGSKEERWIIAFPDISESKADIESRFAILVDVMRQELPLVETYLILKAMEYGVKASLEYLKEDACGAFSQELGGATSGEIYGHKVTASAPTVWQYDESVQRALTEQKEHYELERKATEAEARAMGLATKTTGPMRLTIEIRK